MIPWGGVSCCLSGAALYLLGRSSGRFFSFHSLFDVKLIAILKKLSLIFFCFVTVKGRRGSSDGYARRSAQGVGYVQFVIFSWL